MITNQNRRIAVISAMEEIFDELTGNDINDIPTKTGQSMYVDYNNTIAIIPKTKWIELVMRTLLDAKQKPIIDINYTPPKDEISIAKYSVNYLKDAFKLVESYEKVTLTLRKDFPLTIECNDFKVLVTPIVGND